MEQGKTFDITFECVDEEGNVTALGNVLCMCRVEDWAYCEG